MSIFNSELLKFAKDTVSRQVSIEKGAFTDAATMAGGGGGGAAPMAGPMPPMPPMGGDPAAGGGAPPPPGDPAAGGAPPPIEDPAAAGGGGGMTPEDVKMIVEQVMAANGGGAGGAGGQKMKVDVNTEIYQLKKMMTMLFNQMGIEVPATMMLGDPAQDPAVPASEAAKDPASAAASQGSAISPIEGIQAASPALAAAGGGAGGGGGGGEQKAGEAWNVDTANAERGQEISRSLVQQGTKAAALAQQLRAIGQQHAA